jgi:UDP-glucuronate decarboxylase
MSGRFENVAHLDSLPGFDFIEHDVVDPWPRSLAPKRFDQIFHLACPASPGRYQADPEHTMLTNVVGTRNALRLAEDQGATFLLTSTSEVYGDPEVHPQPEDYRGSVNCTGPRACYDEGKRAAEALAFDFDRAARADTRVARIFNTYGPRMRRDDGRVVSNVICQGLSGEPVTIYGDGDQTRSFCFVDDMVDGLVRLMNCAEARGIPVNLGNPQEKRISELVELVMSLTRSSSAIVRHALPQDDPRRRRPDISRARELLGWSPSITLDEGLRQTVEWFARPKASPALLDDRYLSLAAQ